MPKAKQVSNIELQCILCPKEPRFSDTSHLLTHISSKSHLSHEFQLRVRAQKDDEFGEKCGEKLELFAVWYKQNNLGGLLSERMAAKDNKKSKKARVSDASTASSTASKKQKKGKSQPARQVPAQSPVFRAPVVPQMQAWPMADGSQASLPMGGDYEPNAMYTTPTTRRNVPNFTRQETPLNSRVDPRLTTPTKRELQASNTQGGQSPSEELTGSAKLKGITWPGMDLFDAATPEMRRMRNQRKDDSVLMDMMTNSLASEPAEVSFHANGDFRGSRDIFGPLSPESSPARSIPSTKKRKPRQATKALASLSTNNGPRARPSRAKKAFTAAVSPQKRLTTLMHAPPNPFIGNTPSLNPLVNFEGRYPSVDDTDEIRAAYHEMHNATAFSTSAFREMTSLSPGRTETPLEDQRFDYFAHHGLPTYPSHSMNSAHVPASPTPVSRPTSYRTGAKDNGHAEMQGYHPSRRALSDSQVYPAAMYQEGGSNPLYQHGYARSYGYGGGPYGYTGYGDSRSPSNTMGSNSNFMSSNSNFMGSSFLNDYGKQPNPMANMGGQQQTHGMGPHPGNNTSGNNFGV